MKFYWDNNKLEHSNSIFNKSINILGENSKKVNFLKKKINKIFNDAGLDPFNSEILIYETENSLPFAFVSPFLNLINISEDSLQKYKQEDLLWLAIHEQIHIFEAEIISNLKIHHNPYLTFFIETIKKWLTNKFDIEINIKSDVFDIIDSYVFNYQNLCTDWDNNITFRMKYGNINYHYMDLFETYANIVPSDNNICIAPNNDEGLQFLQGAFIEFLNHWSKNLSNNNLDSEKGKLITIFLHSWILHILFTEILKNDNDNHLILSDARAIYFSAILLNRNISEYEYVFSKADAKIYEANRLKKKYGEEFKYENLFRTINNERLSLQARRIQSNSFFSNQCNQL